MNVWGFAAGCVGSSFLISVCGTWLLRRWAPVWGLVAYPNNRTIHAKPTPVGGGLAIWLAVVFPLGMIWISAAVLQGWPAMLDLLPKEVQRQLPGIVASGSRLGLLLFAGTAIAALGLIDDIYALKWQPKIVVQVLLASLLVAGGVQATLFSSAVWVGWIASGIWLIVLTNSFNFLDNMDALSGGLAVICSSLFAAIMLTGTAQPHWFVGGSLLILAGATGGFLVHNWPPAKIFMGDTGSCFLGLMIAALTIQGTFYDYRTSSPHVALAPLCVLAVPLYDFVSVIVIRLRQGRSPFHADKSHFSHRLVELGLSRKAAVLTIHLVAITTGLGGLLLYQVETVAGAIMVVAQVFAGLCVIAILETAARRSRMAEQTGTKQP